MRIGLLTNVYKPVVNGVTNSISLHKQMLEEWGHEPWIFTLGYANYQDNEPRVIRTRAVSLSDTGYYIGLSLSRQARWLCHTMDILHVHHPFVIGSIALKYGKRYSIPVVFTNHTHYLWYAKYYLPSIIPSIFIETLMKSYISSFANQCDLVIAPTLSIRDQLRDYGVVTRIDVIPNGICLERFREPHRPVTKVGLGLPESARIMIFVGRIALEKNVAFLLRAFGMACRKLPDSYLVFIGSGSEINSLKSLAAHLDIRDRVIFVGKVAYDEVPKYLALADAFVTASITEVHPLSVIEALAAGLPVLGIARTGMADTIFDGTNGLLAEHDLEDFCDKMLLLMQDDDLREQLAEGARESSEQYSIQRTSHDILTRYQELASS